MAKETGLTLHDRRGQPRRAPGPRTVNMSLNVISRVLNDALKRGLLQSNPATDRQLRLKVTHARMRRPSQQRGVCGEHLRP